MKLSHSKKEKKMNKRVRHLHTIYNKNDYVIASFTDLDDYSTFIAKGYMIPTENICDYIHLLFHPFLLPYKPVRIFEHYLMPQM